MIAANLLLFAVIAGGVYAIRRSRRIHLDGNAPHDEPLTHEALIERARAYDAALRARAGADEPQSA